jgi:hypothetical protein
VLDGEHALGRNLPKGDASDDLIGETDERSPRHGARILASAGPLNPDIAPEAGSVLGLPFARGQEMPERQDESPERQR